MNMQSYEILRECEEFINKNEPKGFKASFTCPENAFKFEVFHKQRNATVAYFCYKNDLEPEIAEMLARVVMHGLGYERNDI